MSERNDRSRIDSDSFWDLGVPPKRKHVTADRSDISTTEILVMPPTNGGENGQQHCENGAPTMLPEASSAEIPSDGLPVPPKNTVSRRRGSRQPGDVRPQMAEPVCRYEPERSLIKSVCVLRWPAKYQYFEKFIADAERYFNRTASPCEYVSFYAYMPQYSQMSAAQLQWYLYWRDNARHGNYLQTDYSYLFLYLYEIINLPARVPPEKGVRQICDLWLHYRSSFSRLDRYLGEWLCDYCLVHQLPAPLERLEPILPEISEKVSLKEFYIQIEESGACPFTVSLVDMLTNYNWKSSRCVTPQTKEIFAEHLYTAVLETLAEAWKRSGDTRGQFGLAEVSQTRDAFSGALCSYACKRRIDLTYISFSRSYPLKFLITDLCKLSENCIRAALGIKSRLSTANVPEEMKQIMLAYYNKHLPPMKKVPKSKPPVRDGSEEYAHLYEPAVSELSVENAVAIEQSSWASAELLTRFLSDGAESWSSSDGKTEAEIQPESKDDENFSEMLSKTSVRSTESIADQISEIPCTGNEKKRGGTYGVPSIDMVSGADPFDSFVASLSDREYAALKCIVSGEVSEYRKICEGAFLLADAMTDSINEKASDSFGDIAVVPDGDFYHLSDYYANEITDAILKQEEANGMA